MLIFTSVIMGKSPQENRIPFAASQGAATRPTSKKVESHKLSKPPKPDEEEASTKPPKPDEAPAVVERTGGAIRDLVEGNQDHDDA